MRNGIKVTYDDGEESNPMVKYKFIKPLYEVNRVCPLYYLADTTNELAGVLKENDVKFIIGGSSAIGTAINVTSDYMRRRTSCDIDIFVRKKDYRKIDGIFQSRGWKKYDESESGLIREYTVDADGKRTIVDEYQNIQNLVVYHKLIHEYDVDFLIYMSPIGKYSMKLVRGAGLIEFKGRNRSAEESFVHKIFRHTRRDKADFLAIAETDGLQQLLDDKYARKTFFNYLSDETNIEKLEYLMGRMKDIRKKYWNLHLKGEHVMKKKRQKKKAPLEMRVTLHYQTKDVPTGDPYFEKLILGLEEKAFWLDKSLTLLEDLLEKINVN